jgi:antitoxin component YwqK of YwqJK toxin-antitoxin module
MGRLSLILLLSSTAFVSCKKDKDPSPEPPPVITKKLKSIEENGRRTASFTYNTDGTLKTLVTSSSPGNETTFSFTYDAQKRPMEFVTDEGYKAKFIYQNNLLTLTENYVDGDKVSESSFHYENGRIKMNTLFSPFPQNDGSILYKPIYRKEYQYNANGSVHKILTYEYNALTGQLELEYATGYQSYDDKKNPFAVMADFSQVLLYQPVSANNPLVEKMFDVNGGVDETTEYVYTYDAAGYPLTCRTTIKPTGGAATVINTAFFY